MKFIGLLLFPICFSQSSLAWDAVGVFYSPDKVVVLINERRPEGHAESKLRMLLKQFESPLTYENEREGIKFRCGGSSEELGCTFSFKRGTNTFIDYKSVFADLKWTEKLENAEYNFLNSNGDQFQIRIENGFLYFNGSKR